MNRENLPLSNKIELIVLQSKLLCITFVDDVKLLVFIIVLLLLLLMLLQLKLFELQLLICPRFIELPLFTAAAAIRPSIVKLFAAEQALLLLDKFALFVIRI
jgi:hypothetical protein